MICLLSVREQLPIKTHKCRYDDRGSFTYEVTEGKKMRWINFAGSSLNMDSILFHISAEARSSFRH